MSLVVMVWGQGFIQKFWLGMGEIKCMLGGGGILCDIPRQKN